MAHDCIDWNDWVAVKKNPFPRKPVRKKIIFDIAWNAVEQKLAITCQEHHRIAKDNECRAWTRLLPLHYLAYIHQQLSLVYPYLNPHFSPLQNLTDVCKQLPLQIEVTENDCKMVEHYLLTASEICGHSLVINTLFENDDNADEEYLEDIDDLNRQNYEEAYNRSLEELKGILDMREKADNMLHMATVYALEDEVVANASIALAELYNYHLQPFLNLRELAYSRLQSAQALMNSDDVGARIKDQASLEYADWQIQYIKSVDGIRHLYIEYYTKTTDLITGQRDRMLEDKHRFGRSTFEAYALSRLNHLELFFHEEKLKLLHSRRLHKEHVRNKLQEQLIVINDINDAVEIEDIESEIYLQQIKILDLRLETLQEEEALLKKKLSIIAQQKQESCEDGEFYDAVEDLMEMQTDESVTESTMDPKTLALKDKLASVFRRRAIVRNKKKACVLAREKQKQIQEEEALRLKKHHYVEMKRQERRRLELQRKEQIQEERKATIQRLRAYRMKCNNKRKIDSNEEESTAALTESLKPIEHDLRTDVDIKHESQTLGENDKVSTYSGKSIPSTFITPPSSTTDVQHCESDMDSDCSDATLPSVLSIPLAPPLPPPPPPIPLFHVSSKELHAKNPSAPVLNVRSGDALTLPPCTENRSNATSIDFDELQAVRKRLRKIPALVDLEMNSKVSKEEKDILAARQRLKDSSFVSSKPKNVSDILRETLHRIRVITVDSEESSSEDSNDEDFS